MQRQQIAPNRIQASYDPSRTDAELYKDKLSQEAMLAGIVEQLSQGCGKSGCSNRNSCSTANPSLKAENRSKAI